MPNYIKPTITVAANKNTATNNPGPLSVAISLTTADLLSVDNVQSEIVSVTDGGHKILLDGEKLSGGDGAGGTVGGYVYFSNISAASTTNFIYIGVADDTQAATDMSAADQVDAMEAATRFMTLKVGEFAWFPWDYTTRLFIDTNAATAQKLEYWVFDRA
tara:strand:+ start:771 stop:1250 length:480 start_codon:yes stop_codon:yes gene_type:complete